MRSSEGCRIDLGRSHFSAGKGHTEKQTEKIDLCLCIKSTELIVICLGIGSWVFGLCFHHHLGIHLL